MEKYKLKAALFLISQGITLLGSTIVQFAIIWYVTLQTSSGVWVSVLTAAAYVPQFVISFFSGVWADRFSKKMLIILSDSVIAAATLVLVLMMPHISNETTLLGAIVAISIIRSFGAGIQTPAVNSAVPLLVPEDKLMKFNGINSTLQSVIQFASPVIAGAVLSAATIREVMMIDIATAAVGIGLLFAVAIPFTRSGGEEPSMFSEMKAGFCYAVKEKFIGKLLMFYGIFIFLCVPAGFLASLFITRYYGSSYWNMTLVEVIGFIGMMAGGILISVWGGFRNRVKTLVLGMIAFGILAVGMGATDSFILYLVLMAIYGVALTMIQTASTTLLQENAAAEMQGRMFGLFGAMYSGFLPLGMAVFGPLADVVSMRLLMILSGVFLLVLSAVMLLDKKFYFLGTEKKETE